jgi:undecaprenyl-diphosphatase
VSRSGTTVSALLLRGHPAEGALRLSFLLSVPASLGAGVLVVAETGSAPSVTPLAAAVALGAAAVWGYVTVDALVRLVRTVAFWVVCVGLGSLAVVAGVLVALG